jgi:hypothetical protein
VLERPLTRRALESEQKSLQELEDKRARQLQEIGNLLYERNERER